MQIFKAHYDFIKNTERYQVSYGGAGAGKSVACAQKVILLCSMIPNFNIIVMRKIMTTVRLSVFKMIVSLLEKEAIYSRCHITTSPMKIVFPNKSTINFMGLDDNEKLKSIAGTHGFWLEEADQFTETDINQIDTRLRDALPRFNKNRTQLSYNKDNEFLWYGNKLKNFMLFSFNPISIQNHLYKRFFTNIRSNVKDSLFIKKTTYLDNPILSADYIAQLNSYKEVDENFYNVYCLGNFGTPEGLVYKMPQIIHLEDFPETFDQIYYGMDFGFNNPSTLVFIGIKDKIYYIKELFYQTKLTKDELRDLVLTFKTGKNVIYCDAAEPDTIEYFRKVGINALAGNKSVAAGIKHIKTNIEKIRLCETSEKLIKEFSTYSWIKDGEEFTENPVKINDHALDALYINCIYI